MRIIAIGSAGQNINGDAIAVGLSAWVKGATTTGNSMPFGAIEAVFGVIFLRT
jgi:hypothetical protein